MKQVKRDDFIKALDELLTLVPESASIRIEAEVIEEAKALFALPGDAPQELKDEARQKLFEKLAPLRGPEWTAWAKSTGFGK